ncbi:hypothetical protein shim_01110 [Shimia sp. SK013]|uniref:sulfite exporter TauE/SafE family protein n=1 Tax=Shimia sp. SK013 TaxID=1389006 RepID=UPI0006B4A821|nr:sulfite exporter TauE/SafE family protein [Shimia sp. SK013]KPA23503.1 hypothetical protein shim_01110 [Shimia sp. SK013]
MCNIQILKVTGLSPDDNGVPQRISVIGTVSDCEENQDTGQSVEVTLQCANESHTTTTSEISGGLWYVSFLSNCRCGSAVTVTAHCLADPTCGDEVTVAALECTRCPIVNVEGDSGEIPNYDIVCLNETTARLSFKIEVKNPTGSTVCLDYIWGPAATNVNIQNFCYPSPNNLPDEPVSADFPASPPFGHQPELVIWTKDENGEFFGCPPIIVVLPFIPPCAECLTTFDLNVDVANCSAAFSGDDHPEDCVFHWSFGDGNSAVTPTLTTSHTYAANSPVLPDGTVEPYQVSVVMVCESNDCVPSAGVSVLIENCSVCPTSELKVTYSECKENQRQATYSVTSSGGTPTNFSWQINGAPVPGNANSLTRDETIGDSTSVSVTVVGPGPCTQTLDQDFVTPDCSSSCCPIWLVPLAMAIAASMVTLYLALLICKSLQVDWLWITALAIVAFAFLTCLLVGWIFDCPRRKFDKCFWLLSAWMASLTSFFTALYFGVGKWPLQFPPFSWMCSATECIGCCSGKWWWWFVILGFLIAFLAAFISWIKNCKPGKCFAVSMLALVLTTLTVTLFSYAPLIPVIKICVWAAIPWIVALISAVLAGMSAQCNA